MQWSFLGPSTLWTWGSESRGCWDTPMRHFCPGASVKWWWGGGGDDMFAGHDHALTAKGDTDNGWSGCSTVGLNQSLDGRKKLLYLICPCPPSTT
jgi:hypothetical protein